MIRHVRLVLGNAVLTIAWLVASPAMAQSGLGAVELRPFVVGVVPVVGRGAVGGVSIDAHGALTRADPAVLPHLADLRREAVAPLAHDIARASELRKISLRRLDAALARAIQSGERLADELRFLAGLQQIDFVIAYPEDRDVVLVGRAEGWTIASDGSVVGTSTHRPVLQLADLLVVLRSMNAIFEGDAISCSIDPTAAGLQRLQRLLERGRPRPSSIDAHALARAVGPQRITISGVPEDSHFARVMVAADFTMKRLAMGMEEAPVADLPSYLTLLKRNQHQAFRTSMPRWWLTCDYDSPASSPDGLVWQLRGRSVRAKHAAGAPAAETRPSVVRDLRLAEHWAESFTTQFGAVAEHFTVFNQLLGCMDLAIAAALITRSEWLEQFELELPLLCGSDLLVVAPLRVPRTIDSTASFVRSAGHRIVAISGGVSFALANIVNQPTIESNLAFDAVSARPHGDDAWWWD